MYFFEMLNDMPLPELTPDHRGCVCKVLDLNYQHWGGAVTLIRIQRKWYFS